MDTLFINTQHLKTNFTQLAIMQPVIKMFKNKKSCPEEYSFTPLWQFISQNLKYKWP